MKVEQLRLDWGEQQRPTFDQAEEDSTLVLGLREHIEEPANVFQDVELAARLVEKWRFSTEDTTIGMVTGCFDLAHPNHHYYLTLVRASLAKHHVEKSGSSWDDLSLHQQHAAMASDGVRLVVSVDANELVAGRKGLDSAFPRPVNDWSHRAADISRITYPARIDGAEHRMPVADLVTKHKIRADHQGEGKPPSGDLDVISLLEPDVWLVYEESWETNLVAASEYGVEVSMIQVATNNSLNNPRTAQEFGTTDTVRWILGESS